MSTFLILALATSALAVPFGGDNAHYRHRQDNHAHRHYGAAAPTGAGSHHTGAGSHYPVVNATGWYGAAAGSAVKSAHPVPSGFESDPSDAAPAFEAAAAADSTSCSRSTAYVTHTNQVTVTVHQTTSAQASAQASAVPEQAYGHSRFSMDLHNRDFKAKQRWHWSSNDDSAPTTSTSAATSAAILPVVSSVVAPVVSSAVGAVSSILAPSSTASAVATQAASSSAGKRGVAYNDASLTTPFLNSPHVSWGYNWGQTASGLSSQFNFVPMLWGTGSTFTSSWAATVSAAAAQGVTHLMSFNEPDLSSQANLSPQDAAAAYKTYMQPYAGQFKLGAPAVTNGGGAMGLNWLDAFMKACTGCTIDFVAVHWYDSPSNTAYFEQHVTNASTVAGGKPVWVTEFGATSGSNSDISTFLQTVMPWMDSQSFVERYAYFMVSNGLLVSGGQTTSYGSTYAT